MRLQQGDEDSLKAVSPGAINKSEQGDEDDSKVTRGQALIDGSLV